MIKDTNHTDLHSEDDKASNPAQYKNNKTDHVSGAPGVGAGAFGFNPGSIQGGALSKNKDGIKGEDDPRKNRDSLS